MRLTVVGADGPARYATTTNGEGRFEVLELPADRCSLTVSKGGYVSLQYGQRRPFEPGTPVALADGQALTALDLALPRGSVIAGRITDEFGEPVAQAQVSAQRYQYGPDGQRRLTSSGIPITTDDLGQFRLHSLMPGEYIVSATFRSNFVVIGGTAGSDTSESFLPTFHPGTINASEAQPVTVTLGQESSVQFALSAARMARVSGLVVDSTGRALASAMVVLLPSSGLLSVSGGLTTSQTAADGSFTFANVPPGDYVANVQLIPALTGTNLTESAAVPVSVGGSDLNGLRIATGPALVRGHVEFEGTSSRTAPTPWRVFAQSMTPAQITFSAGSPAANGLVGEDGSFQAATQPPRSRRSSRAGSSCRKSRPASRHAGGRSRSTRAARPPWTCRCRPASSSPAKLGPNRYCA